MKISSPFQDYYDHVPHVYGDGGDPKVLYVRTRVEPLGMFYDGTQHDDIPVEDCIFHMVNYKSKFKIGEQLYQTAAVIICGKIYPVVRKAPVIGRPMKAMEGFHVCTPFYQSDKFAKAQYQGSVFDRKLRDYRPRVFTSMDEAFPESAVALQLCRDLRQPVLFVFDSNRTAYRSYKWDVHRRIPILSHMGFANVLEPTKLYQDIAYFVGNYVNETPDTQPAGKPPQTDKDKIASHGFDSKISFRHRK